MSNDHLSSRVCCVSDAAVAEASEASLLRGPMSVIVGRVTGLLCTD